MSTHNPSGPFVSALRFAAVPTAVSCARAFVRQTLHTWQRPEAAEVAALITSELVTNAVKATGTTDPHPTYAALATVPVIRVRLVLRSTGLIIGVWDASTQTPVLQSQHPDAEHGRGLRIVHAESERWGTTYLAENGGKIVWAEIALRRPEALSAVRLRPTQPPQPTNRIPTAPALA
ncbi:ATP-binding protein [Actinocrinis puniceicyclus]|uniref:ATP-binding protein n=1 Tax=Actinocrinis puniceicyclus TaxID=977794 RepID=A0A8J7WVG4_9ACTN|nr:ATP-binding protein [Actinocrinis puniceicyclus]MBS2966570.1 ATP-binding protein [Actinocrinis puniceicyclus]